MWIEFNEWKHARVGLNVNAQQRGAVDSAVPNLNEGERGFRTYAASCVNVRWKLYTNNDFKRYSDPGARGVGVGVGLGVGAYRVRFMARAMSNHPTALGTERRPTNVSTCVNVPNSSACNTWYVTCRTGSV
jgi:hypothetical protein